MKAKAADHVLDLIAGKVFRNVYEKGDGAVVTVTPSFMALDMDEKRAMINLVIADTSRDGVPPKTIDVLDARTDKPVGRFDWESGLRMD